MAIEMDLRCPLKRIALKAAGIEKFSLCRLLVLIPLL
jgi:hypothetical protein